MTSQTLIPLLDDVITIEPVQQFIGEAFEGATQAVSRGLGRSSGKDREKGGSLSGGWRFLGDRSESRVTDAEQKEDLDEDVDMDNNEVEEDDEDEEPLVDKFGNTIPRPSRSSTNTNAQSSSSSHLSKDTKRIHFIRGPLNDLDPASLLPIPQPGVAPGAESLGVVVGGAGIGKRGVSTAGLGLGGEKVDYDV